MKSYVVVKKSFYRNNFGEDIAMAIDYSDIAVFSTIEKAIFYITKEIEKYKEIENESNFEIQDLRGIECEVKYEAYQQIYNSNDVRTGYVVFEKETR